MKRGAEFADGRRTNRFDDQRGAKAMQRQLGGVAISEDAIVRGIAFAIEQPAGVDVGRIVVGSTAQG